MASSNSVPESHTSSSNPSALPLILDHILSYPKTYGEAPLRTMYTANALYESSSKSPFSEQQSLNTGLTTASQRFRSCLMEQISYLPSQPFSLPPSFITDFVRRCFPLDICLVDFTQALTAMDYLKNLEDRRRREMSAALRRLNVDVATLDNDRESLAREQPGVFKWVAGIVEKAIKIEDLYMAVYVGLRRWVSSMTIFLLDGFIQNNLVCYSTCLRIDHRADLAGDVGFHVSDDFTSL